MSPDRWSTPRLGEFVVAVAGAADETSAVRRGLDWATEALEAEIGIVVEDGAVLASVGFPATAGDAAASVAAICAADGADTPAEVDIPGVGTCNLLSSRVDAESSLGMILARAADDPFSREELGLLHAAARSLTMTLRLFRALAAERTLSNHLQKRQRLLERLSHIQRSITRRLPLPDVLQSITSAARHLLDADVASLRLIDADSREDSLLVSYDGLEPGLASAIERTALGDGATGRAIALDELVVVDHYSAAPEAHDALVGANLRTAMAAPIHEGDNVIGAIVVGMRRPDIEFGDAEREALVAFAEHASLALTDAKRVEHIQHLAFHDELTGLPNRGLFMERLGQMLARARRHPGPIAVLFLDIDRFKTVNDSLGHSAGDQLLIAVAERLVSCLRGEDTAARLGGDEFAILAAADRHGAEEIASRVLAAIEAPFVVASRTVSTAASIGIAVDSDGGHDADGMLRDADTAMYRAKARSGPNYAVFEPSMHAAAMSRIDLEADLRDALTEQQLRLEFQPIVDLRESRVTGVEALVRWQHPTRGLISPLAFVPVAEETGQIHAVGRWVLEESCRQVSDWQRVWPAARGLNASVNLSKRQLQDGRFYREVARALDASGLAPENLILEVTESTVMVDVATAIERLRALRSLGVLLAIDDFGTGQSSLALLRRLPVDIIKIDKLFVDHVTADSTAAQFLEAVVRMGEILTLQVVIEGIETISQASLVAAFGHVRGQGFGLGRPVDVDAIESLLAGGAVIEVPAPGGWMDAHEAHEGAARWSAARPGLRPAS